jgi:hypothetical protein
MEDAPVLPLDSGELVSFGDTILRDASGGFMTLDDGTYSVIVGKSSPDEEHPDSFSSIIVVYLRQSSPMVPGEVEGYVVELHAVGPCYRLAKVESGSFLLIEDEGSQWGNGALDVLWQYCEGRADVRGEIRKGQVTIEDVSMVGDPELEDEVFGDLAIMFPEVREWELYQRWVKKQGCGGGVDRD